MLGLLFFELGVISIRILMGGIICKDYGWKRVMSGKNRKILTQHASLRKLCAAAVELQVCFSVYIFSIYIFYHFLFCAYRLRYAIRS